MSWIVPVVRKGIRSSFGIHSGVGVGVLFFFFLFHKKAKKLFSPCSHSCTQTNIHTHTHIRSNISVSVSAYICQDINKCYFIQSEPNPRNLIFLMKINHTALHLSGSKTLHSMQNLSNFIVYQLPNNIYHRHSIFIIITENMSTFCSNITYWNWQ